MTDDRRRLRAALADSPGRASGELLPMHVGADSVDDAAVPVWLTTEWVDNISWTKMMQLVRVINVDFNASDVKRHGPKNMLKTAGRSTAGVLIE